MDEVAVGANRLVSVQIALHTTNPCERSLTTNIGTPKCQIRGIRLGLQLGPHNFERDIFTLTEKSRFGPTQRL